MSYIEELRKRVESAEQRFGLIDEQQRRYSERLITLMNALETARGEQQAEAQSAQARIAELVRENGELRGMLHALLLGVEAGSRDSLADTLRNLDARLTTMLGAASSVPEPASAAPADEEAPALDTIDLAAGIEESAVIEDDSAAEAIEDEPAAAEPVAEDPSAPAADVIEGALTDETVAADEGGGEDAVTAAEQAVAALIGTGPEGGAPDEMDMELDDAAGAAETAAVDEPAPGDETVFEEAPAETAEQEIEMEIEAGAHEAAAASPVGEMIERLAEETKDFPEPAPTDEAAAVPEPAAPKAARKKA